MARKGIPLPNYPAVLLEERPSVFFEKKRLYPPLTEEKKRELFTALCNHYQPVGSAYAAPHEHIKPTTLLWIQLARMLLEDFVPAYRVSPVTDVVDRLST